LGTSFDFPVSVSRVPEKNLKNLNWNSGEREKSEDVANVWRGRRVNILTRIT